VGIDLTRAATAIYYSTGYDLGAYIQSRARVHRPGQTRPVTYVHLIAEGTIDESILAALRAREDVVTSILASARRRVQ
jgi:SNF2 family DNA or RNA helicase